MVLSLNHRFFDCRFGKLALESWSSPWLDILSKFEVCPWDCYWGSWFCLLYQMFGCLPGCGFSGWHDDCTFEFFEFLVHVTIVSLFLEWTLRECGLWMEQGLLSAQGIPTCSQQVMTSKSNAGTWSITRCCSLYKYLLSPISPEETINYILPWFLFFMIGSNHPNHGVSSMWISTVLC